MKDETLFPLLIIYGIFCLIAGAAASDKKMGFWNGFGIAVFFTPWVAVICAYISGDKEPKQPKA